MDPSGSNGFQPVRKRPAIIIIEARVVLVSFLFTFMAARLLVYMIMAHRLPDLYLHLGAGQTHVHQLNYGNFHLSIIGAYLIFMRPSGRHLSCAAAVYGIGMGLTFDEFGMWYHLTAQYWQVASFDAVVVIAAVLGLIALAPELRRFRPHHWITAVLMLAAVIAFYSGLAMAFHHAAHRWGPGLHRLEQSGPKE